MSRLISLLLVCCIPMLIVAGVANATGEPSSGAKGMSGAMGTFEFKPDDWMEEKTTWWKDSDGVAPGTAGCHIGTDSEGAPNGRMFGEACLPDGLLVESNPGADTLHSHKNDIEHPANSTAMRGVSARARPRGPALLPPHHLVNSPPCALANEPMGVRVC